MPLDRPSRVLVLLGSKGPILEHHKQIIHVQCQFQTLFIYNIVASRSGERHHMSSYFPWYFQCLTCPPQPRYEPTRDGSHPPSAARDRVCVCRTRPGTGVVLIEVRQGSHGRKLRHTDLPATCILSRTDARMDRCAALVGARCQRHRTRTVRCRNGFLRQQLRYIWVQDRFHWVMPAPPTKFGRPLQRCVCVCVSIQSSCFFSWIERTDGTNPKLRWFSSGSPSV